MTTLDKMIDAVEAYAEREGIKPETVLRNAVGSSFTRWPGIKDGSSDMTSRTIKRVMDYIKGR